MNADRWLPSEAMPVASFHLARFPRSSAARIMAGTLLDRPALAATPGLRFARQLGTGRGRQMGLGADLRRWAMIAVWDDDAALDRFLGGSPLARRWRIHAEESFLVRLEPLASHGSWGGTDPFAPDPAEPPAGPPPAGSPVAVLTRATIPLRHWRAFHRSVSPVESWMHDRGGDLLAAAGVGERPVGTLATFSLWRSADAVRAFAYGAGPHADVVRATRDHGWFAEELFARFRPYGAEGTWDGTAPLTRS